MVLFEARPPSSSDMRFFARDAKTTRSKVTAPTAKTNITVPHFYPRSFSYNVRDDGKGTDVIMYGSNLAGQTVAVRAINFYPYMFVRAAGASPDEVKKFVAELDKSLAWVALQPRNGSLGTQLRTAIRKHSVRPVMGYEMTWGVSVKSVGEDRGYNGGEQELFLKIYFYSPSCVRAARDLLELSLREDVIANSNNNYGLLLAESVINSRKYAPKISSERTAKEASTKAKLISKKLNLSKKYEREDDNEPINPWDDEKIDLEEEIANAGFVPETITLTEEPLALEQFAGLRQSLMLNDAPAQSFEADIDFVLRFCIDAGIGAEKCVTFKGADTMGPFRDDGNTLSDIEFSIDWRALQLAAEEELQNAIPPQCVLSIDCEMELGPNGAFPKPETEKMLQVCCVVSDPANDPKCKRKIQRVFALESIESPEGDETFAPGEVHTFTSEEHMFLAFALWVRNLQPDAMTGWNMENFDMSYMLQRAATLGVSAFPYMSRDPQSKLRATEKSFSSSAHGTHLFSEVKGEGLWIWDLFQAFKRSTSYKLRRYSLEFVAHKFLKDRKEDVAYSMINTLQQTAQGRFKLAKYCMKDALLPLRIMGNRQMMVENIEIARIANVPVDMVCRRGMQVRMRSTIYKIFFEQEVRYLLYTMTFADRSASTGTYEGAHVEPPDRGLHDEVTVTLDFASLYPSIMSTLNICITTLLSGKRRTDYSDDKLWWIEDAIHGSVEDQPGFVREEVFGGLLPRILREWLAERKAVKKKMAAAEKRGDEEAEVVFDKRQLAIKLICNSLYGFLGTGVCREAAATVTAFGRFLIRKTRDIVHKHFTRENGYAFDAKVIYGDTDSVFVKLMSGQGPAITVEESVDIGKEMCTHVNKAFQEMFGERKNNILKLEYEKSFSRLMLYQKKRYAGIKHVLKFDEKLGTEVIKRLPGISTSGTEADRRDACLLVSQNTKKLIEILLQDNKSVEERLDEARRMIWETMIIPIQQGRVDWSLLIQSKQFRKRSEEYWAKGKKPPLHILLAEKLDKRHGAGNPGTYKPGDRIQFVVVSGQPGQKTSECGEDPDYAWNNKLKLNQEHYIERAVKGVVMRQLEPILIRNETFATEGEHQRTLTRRFESFLNANTRNISRPPQTTSSVPKAISRLGLKRKERCRLCGAPGSLLCDTHPPEERAAFEQKSAKLSNETLEMREELYQTCYSCQNDGRDCDQVPKTRDIEELMPCNNSSCDIYWRRRNVDRMIHTASSQTL